MLLTTASHKHRKLDVPYTDFIKAFDKVFHRKFINKLRVYDVGCKCVQDMDQVNSFLIDRQQRVVIGDITSTYRKSDTWDYAEDDVKLIVKKKLSAVLLLISIYLTVFKLIVDGQLWFLFKQVDANMLLSLQSDILQTQRTFTARM